MPMVAPCRVMAIGVFDSRKLDRFSRNSRIPTLVACMGFPRCVHNDNTTLEIPPPYFPPHLQRGWHARQNCLPQAGHGAAQDLQRKCTRSSQRKSGWAGAEQPSHQRSEEHTSELQSL